MSLRWLIAATTGYSIEFIDSLPITEFRRAVEIIIHKDDFIRGGDLVLMSSTDKRNALMEEHKRFFPEKWN